MQFFKPSNIIAVLAVGDIFVDNGDIPFLDDNYFSPFRSNSDGPVLSSMYVRSCWSFTRQQWCLAALSPFANIISLMSFDFEDLTSSVLLFDGETIELEELIQLSFVNVMFILSIVLNCSSVSPCHYWTGWQNAFNPLIWSVIIVSSRCHYVLRVQSTDKWLHTPCIQQYD